MCTNYREERIQFLMETFDVNREAAERIYDNAIYGCNKDTDACIYVMLGK